VEDRPVSERQMMSILEFCAWKRISGSFAKKLSCMFQHNRRKNFILEV